MDDRRLGQIKQTDHMKKYLGKNFNTDIKAKSIQSNPYPETKINFIHKFVILSVMFSKSVWE